jgi:polysaccharide export outer membrane protein
MSAAMAVLALAGCAGLPSSGPTAHQILGQAAPRKAPPAFRVVTLDQDHIDALNAAAHAGSRGGSLASLADAALRGVVGPGDTLSIDLYEVGVSLFSGSRATAAGADAFDASAHGEQIAAVTVDENGDLRLPFAGKIHVAGKTPGEVEQLIEQRLAGQSQHPQVVVSLKDSVYSSVVVSGNVHKPGRIALTPGRERIVDAIAAAGGTETSADDVMLRFSRGGRRIEQRLGDIEAGSGDDLVLDPGDRIDAVRAPRSFTVFGATGKVSEVSFDVPRVSLAEALARSQGPNDAAADPSAIFLFRNGALAGPDGLPTIYRINMLDAKTYFLAQKLSVQDKDLIYIANARANQPGKFVAIINQLFSPAVAVRAISQ